MRKLGLLMILACMVSVSVQAQEAPDFQLIMNGLQAKLDAITVNTWSSTAYSSVVGLSGSGYNPPFNQGNPSFVGRAHIENNIKDDDHLALLQKVLENDACVREKLGGTFVDNVRTTFFANRDLVTTRETNFQVRLFDSTRIDLNYIISANNRPAWTDPAVQTFTTGTSNTIGVCVDSGIIFVGTTCLSQAADIPSLWGDGGLMNEAAPGLSEDVANLMAAYLTMGNQSMVDYFQAVMFQTFHKGVLPNIMGLIFNLLGKGVPVDASLIDVGMEDFDVGSKAYVPIGGAPDVNVDVSYNPPFVVAPADPYIAIRRAVARVSGIQAGVLQYWLNWYQVGANGFGAGYATRLPATGDLDLNGTTNLAAYNAAGQNRAQFLVNAGAGITFGFIQDPIPANQTKNYGEQAFFNCQAAGGTGGGITYQWYAGPTPATLQPVSGATGQTYNPVVLIYSVPPVSNSFYYQCRATTFACGQNITTNSTTVVVTGGDPPPITVYDQPASGDYQPGGTITLTTNAGVAVGTLSYEWQKYDTTFENWIPIPGATSSQLVVGPLSIADAGSYRCKISNVIDGKDDKANPVYFEFTDPAVLNVAPTIVIDPQPVGADLNIGANLTISSGASVTSGNLKYRWQKNPGTGYINLTGWVDSGATSFTSDWNIVGATINDSGTYRLQVENTVAPYGSYSLNSAAAAVNVSSGVLFYVDPTSPTGAPGTSWENAFWSLQDAIDAANAAPGGTGGEVWVAGGTIGAPIVYDEPRTVNWGGSVGDPGRVIGSLVMKSNVGLYGGFEGYRGGAGKQESNRLQRNRALNICVIDGSTARGGLAAYHVVVFGSRLAATVNAVIDGFTITGGNATGIASDYHTWRGGGIYNYGSSPTIANCIIADNRAAVSGGGIANEISSFGTGDATIINCLIDQNHADRDADGGAGPDGGNPIRGGGGVFNNQSSSTTNFTTLAANTIDSTYTGDPLGHGLNSGGVYTWNATPLVTNTIVWGNNGSVIHEKPFGFPLQDTTVTYSDVQGGYAGTGNLNTNPLLGNAAYIALLGAIGNYVPAVGSPVLNTGDPTISGGDDLLGVFRPLPKPAGLVDMGAFELSTLGPVPACINIGLDFIAVPNTAAIDPFTVYDAENSASEAPVTSVTLTPKTFGCADIPTTTIELVATDILGRTGTCNATVTVTESQDPTPVCNNISVNLDGAGNYALTPADKAALSAGSSDNCTAPGNLVINVAPSSFTCAQAGQAVNVTVTVADAIGNDASCTAQVTVVDNIAPVPPVAPAAISVDLLPNGTYQLALADLQNLGAGTTDNCGVDLPGTTATPNLFTCADLGTNSVSITVYDVNGNSATGTADVTVNDVTPPALTGVVNRTHVAITGLYTEAAALSGVGADDVCDGDVTGSIVLTVFDESDNPVTLPIDPEDRGDGQPWIQLPEISYDFTMVYTVQDGSANQTEQESTLTLLGLQVPIITILGDNPATVQCPAAYSDAGATAFDPESNQFITSSMTTTIAVNSGVPGNYTVTYSVGVPGYPSLPPTVEVRDVVVADTAVPVITLVADNPLYWQRGDAFPNDATIRTANDACDGSLTGDIVTTGVVNINALGSYDLEFDVVDGEGNPADTVELTVIVIDQIEIIEQPVGATLYTDDDPVTLTAAYRYGSNVSGYQWYQDATGLGFVADTDSPNTVTLAVDPAVLDPDTYQYRLDVTDDTGPTPTNNATVRVADRLRRPGLDDKLLIEGNSDTWTPSGPVTGGYAPVTYQWQASRAGDKAFVPVVDGPYGTGAYSGAQTDELSFEPFAASMAGQYQVEVSDDEGDTLIIGPATLTAGSGAPVAGVFGLAALALATALGGAATLRRRK